MPPRQRSARKVRQSSCTFSDLPDNVIDNIAMRLPLKEAVRTSILSRKWRFVWARLPQLILNGDFFPPAGSSGGKRKPKKIIPSIYEILVLHHAPVSKFVLTSIGELNCPEIDKILLFLSRHGIEDLTLRADISDLKMPSHFFSCVHLKHLHLTSFALYPPPTFQGFSNLISLHLEYVKFPSVLTSFAPKLERLTLVKCYYFNSIAAEPYETVEIIAPNLRFLEVKGSFRQVILKKAPRLLDAHLETSALKESSALQDFFRCAPSMEKLVLELGLRYRIENDHLPEGSAVGRPERPLVSCHLKHLHLKLYWSHPLIAFSSALWLFKNSPNLESLVVEHIFYQGDDDSEDIESIEALDCSGISLDHLKEVAYHRANGTLPEMHLMRVLLANAPSLRKFVIKPGYRMNPDDEMTLLKEVARCPRASTVAEVEYMDRNGSW